MDDMDNLQTSVLSPALKLSRFSRRETMKFRTQISFLILCLLVAVNSAAAALRLPALVSDHMVLQQGTDVCARKHQKRHSDFRRGKRLGNYDHIIVWTRPFHVCQQ